MFSRLCSNPTVATRIGLVCLVAATALHLWLAHSASRPSGLVDSATGLLYGVAIGFLLLALRLRRGSPAGTSPCA